MHCQPIPDKDRCPLILADENSIWASWWSQSDIRAWCPLVFGSTPVKPPVPDLDMEDQKQRATSVPELWVQLHAVQQDVEGVTLLARRGTPRSNDTLSFL
jgi:hypothetical protein